MFTSSATSGGLIGLPHFGHGAGVNISRLSV
jgi:hypothetical protein